MKEAEKCADECINEFCIGAHDAVDRIHMKQLWPPLQSASTFDGLGYNKLTFLPAQTSTAPKKSELHQSINKQIYTAERTLVCNLDRIYRLTNKFVADGVEGLTIDDLQFLRDCLK